MASSGSRAASLLLQGLRRSLKKGTAVPCLRVTSWHQSSCLRPLSTVPSLRQQRKVDEDWNAKLKQELEHIRASQASESDPGPVDPADPTGELEIYRGLLSTQVKLVKSFSLMTSAIGLACQPVLYIKAQNSPHMALIIGTGAFLSFFTFATPLLIHYVSKKYVTELYYNRVTDTYKAVTYSLLLRKKELTFRLSDVQVPDLPGMFTTFKAKSQPLFVDGTQFHDLEHFGKIMGYDKPLDLRMRDGVTSGHRDAQDRWERVMGRDKKQD